jgi:hypothetical protein
MSTRRADFRAALAAILEDFRLANPTLLRQTYRARPATFNPPLAYVGLINEPTISHQFGGQRVRDQRGSLIVVQGVYENAETADKLDVLADALITYLTSQHARVSGATLLEPVSSEDVDLAIGEVTYAATIVVIRHDVVE